MKYIILLLAISASCLAQTKVTAYRLIVESDDGPCSVKNYVETYDSDIFLYYVMAEFDDEILVNKLLSIKQQSKNWKSIGFNCNDGVIGGDIIHNMFVIENKGKNDTIFTTRGNGQIVFPDENKAFIDKSYILNKALTGSIKEFFEYNFGKDLQGMLFGEELESISVESVVYKEKNLYGYTKEKFEEEFGNLIFAEEIESYPEGQILYEFEGNFYTFDVNGLLIRIDVLTANTSWQFDNQNIGSKVEALKKDYPISMSFNVIYTVKFEDFKKENLHWIMLEEDKGALNYWIKDGKLDGYEIYFDYP